jgi:uracil-DNA glycosylase
MLIGDGGTDEDINTGYALSGSVERTLRGFCNDNKLKYDEFYKTLLIKERTNQKKWEANVELLTDQYKEILLGEIRTIRPNIIVPIGELAFRFSTGLEGIRKFRGSIIPSRTDLVETSLRTIPILGPNPYINEDYKLNFIARLDFSKIAKTKDCTDKIEEIGKVWIAHTAESFRNFCERHYRKASFVILDIETYCGIPTCISFCFDGKESCTVPLLDRNISFGERVLLIHEVAKLLASDLPKVNQNIKFDWKKLERFGFYVKNICGDTLLATSCIYCEFPKNLGFLTSIYTDMPYFKDEGKQFDPAIHNRERLYLYCAKDSLATHKIYVSQMVEIKEQGVEAVYNKLIEILPVYKKMEENGIRIDQEQQERLILKYESLFDIQKLKFQYLVGERANPLSDDQVRRIVYDELKYKRVEGVKRTKSGADATDEESLEILMWAGTANSSIRDGTEILKSVIACRKLHKVLEYLYSPIHPDGYARCEFNLAGAETGRTTTGKTTDSLVIYDRKSSKKGLFKNVDLGRSFQNIGKHGFEIEGTTLGKDLRSMFVPSRGYSFVECDLSQAEARVDAVLASDLDILSVFDGPIGIHRLTGSWLYDCPPEEIKKGILINGVDRYHEAKTARHAGERNMKETRLMMMIKRPKGECIKILNKFHAKQPSIRAVFHKEVYENVQKHKLLIAPNGRRHDFFGHQRELYDMVNRGISFLPQAIVTDYLKDPLREIYDTHDWARPLNEQHDGFLSEVPVGREEEHAELTKRLTMKPINFKTCSLSRDYELVIPMKCESSETNWAEMEELKI